MLMRLRTIALSLLLALTAPAMTTAQSPAPASHDALVAQNAVEVVLLEAGAEPRSEIRYDLAAMTAQNMRMDMLMNMAMSNPMMGSQAMTFPLMRMNMAMTEMTMNEAGHLRMAFAFRSAEVMPREGADPAMVAGMQGALAGMENVTGFSVIDTRGNVIEAGFDASNAPPAAQQQLESMRDSLEQMVAPMPVEAVGIGARWQITTNVVSNGASIQQVATYRLIERTENAIRLEVSMTQTAADQQINDPNIPPPMTVWIDSYNASGGGTATISLNSPVPESTATIESAMSMSLDDGSGTRAPYMTMEMDMSITISAGE
jgi:hypothetical protein